MANKELIDSYEELVNYTAEIRESLDILHSWLSKKPDFDKLDTYFDLIMAHGQHWALLNLIMYRLDELLEKHTNIIEEAMKGN